MINCVQTARCLSLALQAMAKLQVVGYREDDMYLHCAPLFHIGGLSSMIAMLAVGATQARVPTPCVLMLKHNIKVVAMQSRVRSCRNHALLKPYLN